ncbi:hypothetical protein WA538_000869, partial [Blastocystis sp. DL]
MLVETAATIDKKIGYFDKKADAVQAKRDKYYEAAKKARSMGRKAETIRFLRGVKQCDEDYQRYSNMSSKLNKLKSVTEAYLDHSDFLRSVQDTTTLIDEFGLKPEDAENLMDKMIEQRDLVKDMDSAVAEGLDEDMGDLDDMLADLDKEMAADKMHDLPEAGKDEPTAKSLPSTPTETHPVHAKPAASHATADLEAELENLFCVCWHSNHPSIHSYPSLDTV